MAILLAATPVAKEAQWDKIILAAIPVEAATPMSIMCITSTMSIISVEVIQLPKVIQLVKIPLVAIPVEAATPVVKVIQLVKIPLVAIQAEAATPVAKIPLVAVGAAKPVV